MKTVFNQKKNNIFVEWYYSKKITVGHSDMIRRNNLLNNLEYSLKRADSRFKLIEKNEFHTLFAIGSEEHGFIQYKIINKHE